MQYFRKINLGEAQRAVKRKERQFSGNGEDAACDKFHCREMTLGMELPEKN